MSFYKIRLDCNYRELHYYNERKCLICLPFHALSDRRLDSQKQGTYLILVHKGEMPNNKLKLIKAWVEIHQEDLMADWKLAVEGQQPHRIEPLR
jgi:hypothetical protein